MAQVAIEMTLPVYDGLIDKCDQSSREYAVLKNGVIVCRPKDDRFERIVEIDCDSGDANRLLALATKIYPDAVADISKGIATSIKKPPKPVD